MGHTVEAGRVCGRCGKYDALLEAYTALQAAHRRVVQIMHTVALASGYSSGDLQMVPMKVKFDEDTTFTVYHPCEAVVEERAGE